VRFEACQLKILKIDNRLMKADNLQTRGGGLLLKKEAPFVDGVDDGRDDGG
jgi:hypothetical protein